MTTLTPQEIVSELDKFIIGQHEAKRAVAIAFRNRYRRQQISDDEVLKEEIVPKNILMIGPTGVGKTEIARRLAKLADAPFIKVEATKFTEVGYVGRDVDSIIRELVEVSVNLVREQSLKEVKEQAMQATEERILDALLPPPKIKAEEIKTDEEEIEEHSPESEESDSTRNLFRERLREGSLDDKEIEIEVLAMPIGFEIMAPAGMEDMTSQIQNIFQNISSDRVRRRKMRVKDAKKIIGEEEASKLVKDEDLKAEALLNVEQNGIVFIDEIDKVTRRSDHTSGADVSREGVQRDLLPLVEGCTVSTKHGMVKTDHILFIASGAFHLSKPSDLIPELQGRLPIRVELKALKVEDLSRILIEPRASLTRQYEALLGTEKVTIQFTDSGIKRIAEIAWQVNERSENIGARRLHTIMERLLEEISFAATDLIGQTIVIDDAYVDKRLAELVKDEDLSRYIL